MILLVHTFHKLEFFWREKGLWAKLFLWSYIEICLHACSSSYFYFVCSLGEIQIQRILYPIFSKNFARLKFEIWGHENGETCWKIKFFGPVSVIRAYLKIYPFVFSWNWSCFKLDKIFHNFYVGALKRWGQIKVHLWHAMWLPCFANWVWQCVISLNFESMWLST